MPRSKNPHNYEDFFWEVLRSMKASPKEITFDLPAYRAHRLRHRAYGFIYALESNAERLKKDGKVKESAERFAEANLMRGYLISVTINGTAHSKIQPSNIQPAKLHFVNRDLTEENLDLLAQLAKQMNGQALPREESNEEILPPSLDEFFDTNLKTPEGEVRELNDDEGNPSNSSEEPPA